MVMPKLKIPPITTSSSNNKGDVTVRPKSVKRGSMVRKKGRVRRIVDPDFSSQQTAGQVEGVAEVDEAEMKMEREEAMRRWYEEQRRKYPVAPDGYIPNSIVRRNLKPHVPHPPKKEQEEEEDEEKTRDRHKFDFMERRQNRLDRLNSGDIMTSLLDRFHQQELEMATGSPAPSSYSSAPSSAALGGNRERKSSSKRRKGNSDVMNDVITQVRQTVPRINDHHRIIPENSVEIRRRVEEAASTSRHIEEKKQEDNREPLDRTSETDREPREFHTKLESITTGRESVIEGGGVEGGRGGGRRGGGGGGTAAWESDGGKVEGEASDLDLGDRNVDKEGDGLKRSLDTESDRERANEVSNSDAGHVTPSSTAVRIKSGAEADDNPEVKVHDVGDEIPDKRVDDVGVTSPNGSLRGGEEEGEDGGSGRLLQPEASVEEGQLIFQIIEPNYDDDEEDAEENEEQDHQGKEEEEEEDGAGIGTEKDDADQVMEASYNSQGGWKEDHVIEVGSAMEAGNRGKNTQAEMDDGKNKNKDWSQPEMESVRSKNDTAHSIKIVEINFPDDGIPKQNSAADGEIMTSSMTTIGQPVHSIFGDGDNDLELSKSPADQGQSEVKEDDRETEVQGRDGVEARSPKKPASSASVRQDDDDDLDIPSFNTSRATSSLASFTDSNGGGSHDAFQTEKESIVPKTRSDRVKIPFGGAVLPPGDELAAWGSGGGRRLLLRRGEYDGRPEVTTTTAAEREGGGGEEEWWSSCSNGGGGRLNRRRRSYEISDEGFDPTPPLGWHLPWYDRRGQQDPASSASDRLRSSSSNADRVEKSSEGGLLPKLLSGGLTDKRRHHHGCQYSILVHKGMHDHISISRYLRARHVIDLACDLRKPFNPNAFKFQYLTQG